MPRNLERRVEIMFPIETPGLRSKLMNILTMQLKDTAKAHVLMSDGTYEKVDRRGKGTFNAQLEFGRLAMQAAKENDELTSRRVFIPETHHE